MRLYIKDISIEDNPVVVYENKNPMEQEIKQSLNLLIDNENYCLFIEVDELSKSTEMIQCRIFDNNFALEMRLNNLNNPRVYCYDTGDVNKATKILVDFTNLILPEMSYWDDLAIYGEDDLVKADDLCEIIRSYDLAPLYATKEENNNNVIVIQTTYLKSIIDIAKESGVKHIFYSYKYVNKKAFSIDECKSGFSSNRFIFEAAKEKIEKYKKRIEETNFARPATLELFCIINGFIIMVRLKALWVDRLMPAKDFLNHLEVEYREKMNELEEENEKQNIILRKELESILLSDKEFLSCTNQKLRENFMKKFFNKPENWKYEDTFRQNHGFVDWFELRTFTDAVFKMSK